MFTLSLVIFLALDQFSKYLVDSSMELGQTIPLIKGVFDLTYVRNDGAAWNILSGKQTLLIVVTGAVMLTIIAYVIVNRKKISLLEKLSLGMIVGGGIGNLIGRASVGYVIDFLNIQIIPVFNVADIGVTVGCILLILTILKSK